MTATTSVGDIVVVTNPNCTYDDFPGIGELVPRFEYGNAPRRGDHCTVTYVGQHQYSKHENDEHWRIYVLDNKFIVGAAGIKKI